MSFFGQINNPLEIKNGWMTRHGHLGRTSLFPHGVGFLPSLTYRTLGNSFKQGELGELENSE